MMNNIQTHFHISSMRTFFTVTLFSLLILSGCAKKGEENSSAQSEVPSSGDFIGNVSKVNSVQKGEGTKVADFSWTDETGKQVSFSDFSKDNVVLINFWATWCGPCKRELPDLVALHNEYKDKNIKIIGISVDRDGDVVNLVHTFAVQANLAYPIVIDNGELEQAFGGIRGIPTSFFVNKKGEIVKKMIGMQTKETFQAELLAASQ
ncbi:MAG: TlpA disulfide reductase family protein [Bacteroidota bacterium]